MNNPKLQQCKTPPPQCCTSGCRAARRRAWLAVCSRATARLPRRGSTTSAATPSTRCPPAPSAPSCRACQLSMRRSSSRASRTRRARRYERASHAVLPRAAAASRRRAQRPGLLAWLCPMPMCAGGTGACGRGAGGLPAAAMPWPDHAGPRGALRPAAGAMRAEPARPVHAPRRARVGGRRGSGRPRLVAPPAGSPVAAAPAPRARAPRLWPRAQTHRPSRDARDPRIAPSRPPAPLG